LSEALKMVRTAHIQAILETERVAVQFRATKRAMEILLKGKFGRL